MPPSPISVILSCPAPRISTPVVPDSLYPSMLLHPLKPTDSHTSPSLRLLLANDFRIKLRHLLYRYRATGLLAPHLPDHPEFLTPGLLRLMARNAPELLHADDECLLLQSIKYRQAECVRILLDRGADVNAGWCRCWAGHVSKACAASMARPYPTPALGKTHPMARSQSLPVPTEEPGSPPLFTFRRPQPINHVELENAPLLMAVRCGHVDLVRLLLDYGADLSFDRRGRLVYEATHLGHWTVLEVLLLHGASHAYTPFNEGSGPDSDNEAENLTVMERVVEVDTNGEADLMRVFQLLVTARQHVAPTRAEDFYKIGRRQRSMSICSEISVSSLSGKSSFTDDLYPLPSGPHRHALNLCTKYGNLRLLHWLVTYLNVPVHHLTPRCATSLPVLRYLFERGMCFHIKPDLHDIFRDHTTQTVEHAMLWIEYGADPNSDGGRALKDACSLGLYDILAFLMQRGNADLEEHGDACVELALAAGHVECLRVLIDHGVDPIATLLQQELQVASPETIKCDLYVGVEVGHDGVLDASIRGRAPIDRFRLSECDYWEALEEVSTTLVESIKEILLACGGGRLHYCLEDTCMETDWITDDEDDEEEEEEHILYPKETYHRALYNDEEDEDQDGYWVDDEEEEE